MSNVNFPFHWSDAHFHSDGLSDENIGPFFERAKGASVGRLICAASTLCGMEKISEQYGGRLNPDYFAAIQRTAHFGAQVRGEPCVWTAFGVHPWSVESTENASALSVDEGEPGWEEILRRFLTAADPAVPAPPGVGEIGLDFALRRLNQERKKRQRDFFVRQLEIAEEFRRPIVVHSVRAGNETFDLLAAFPRLPLILMHGFAGQGEMIERLADLGAYFSFSAREIGAENLKGRAAILAAPADRILLESDYPSGGEPSEIPQTAERIAALRGETFDRFAERIQFNESAFFQKWHDTRI